MFQQAVIALRRTKGCRKAIIVFSTDERSKGWGYTNCDLIHAPTLKIYKICFKIYKIFSTSTLYITNLQKFAYLCTSKRCSFTHHIVGIDFGNNKTMGIISVEKGESIYGNETDAWYSFNSRRLNSKLTQYANRYLYIMVKRQWLGKKVWTRSHLRVWASSKQSSN